MLKRIFHELKEHSSFTILGAMTGIVLMMAFKRMPHETAHRLFYFFHPLHVLLSAIVTTALYVRYKDKKDISGINIWKIVIVGIIGSVGIGTLSDSLIPFWGERLLDMPHSEAHIGFLEKPWLVSLFAVVGVVIGYLYPSTKHPHTGHVLISTWASLFHILMASDHQNGIPYFGVFIFLFLAVWLPCCLSDIVFPLLFVKKGAKKK